MFTDHLEYYLPGKGNHFQAFRSSNDERRHRDEPTQPESTYDYGTSIRQALPTPITLHTIDADKLIKLLHEDRTLQCIQKAQQDEAIGLDVMAMVIERFICEDEILTFPFLLEFFN